MLPEFEPGRLRSAHLYRSRLLGQNCAEQQVEEAERDHEDEERVH